MDTDELARKIKAMGKDITRSNLLGRCINVAKRHGRRVTYDVLQTRTIIEWEFCGEDIKIRYDTGGGMGNHDTLYVDSEGKRVLYADSYSEKETLYPMAKARIILNLQGRRNNFISEEYQVREFRPGEWEQAVAKLARSKVYLHPEDKKARKEAKTSQEVSPDLVEKLKESFPSLKS